MEGREDNNPLKNEISGEGTSGCTRMAVVEEQQQQLQSACYNDENAAHLVNQESSQSVQNLQRYGVDKMQVGMRTTELCTNVANQAAVPLSRISNENRQKECYRKAINGVFNADWAEVDFDIAFSRTARELPVESHASAPMGVDDSERVEIAEQEAVKSDGDVHRDNRGDEVKGITDFYPTKSAKDEIMMEVEAVSGGYEEGNAAIVNEGKTITQQMTTESAVVVFKEDVEMATEMEAKVTMHMSERFGCKGGDTEIAVVVNELIKRLVENVVEVMKETMSVDAEYAKRLSSPIRSHLSADETMELIEEHHDEEMLPDTSAPATEITDNHEYQWFDGEEDNDDEGAAVELGPSLFDITTGTPDDVFGLKSIGVSEAMLNICDNVDVKSDGSGDTLVLATKSQSTSSSSSSSNLSSGISSCDSDSSSSEKENSRLALKQRRNVENSGSRKLLKYKENRVRLEIAKGPQRKPLKRKRKISPPVIPPEFEVFQTGALDPILRGSYAVRNDRRASFIGNWSFSEPDFQESDKISPFEYTSRARVLPSRRKDDNRPLSGKYGGYFKLRQFNGSLVKVREDQVDLQFLPMSSSDEEVEGEDEEMESDEDGDEPIASRYVVLGKGKNRFGRFLIRGYLNSASGRLSVKRRYLE